MGNFFGNINLEPQLNLPRSPGPEPGRPTRAVRPVVKIGSIRRYDGAAADRFMQDWVSGQSRNVTAEILPYLRTMIARSRDLFQNNDYAKGFLGKVKTNIVPAHGRYQGMRLQMKIKGKNGAPDNDINKTIEGRWDDFCKPGQCDATRRLSMSDITGIAVQSMVRDGAVFVRKLAGFNNENRFAIQLLDIDYLDFDYRLDLGGGRRIIGGVELDSWGAPVAYHLLAAHPGGDDFYTRGGKKYRRIPAEQIICLGVVERAEQYHFAPWLHASLIRMRMLGKYEESEAIAARVAASKMGFFIPDEGKTYTGDDLLGTDDEESIEDEPDFITQAEPGIFEELPSGVDFKTFDPQHPSTAFSDFCRHMLRGAAVGQGVSYINFANDLREANFGSMRQGELSERDMWMLLQSWIGTHLLDNLFGEWLRIQMVTGSLPYQPARFPELNRPTWMGKRWAWIDPLKDAKANKESLEGKYPTKTIGDVIAEGGGDFDDTMDRWARELPIIEKIFGKEKDGGE